jgi:protein subunit release factor A
VEDLHYTKKDFNLDWYSGSGAGGQHRNRHKNCVRITHIESGMVERGTESRSRVDNQRVAFTRLAKRVVAWAMAKEGDNTDTSNVVIRNYNESRNEVHDKLSGLKRPYNDIVKDGNIGEMIEARRNSTIKE